MQAAISVGMGAIWLIGRIPIFQRAYSEHMRKREDDAWLRNQCKDPLFISRLQQHPEVCDRVRASYGQPAMLVGLQACIPSDIKDMISWEMLAVLLIALPSLVLPYYRARRDRRDRDRMLEACSPELPAYWRVRRRKLLGV